MIKDNDDDYDDDAAGSYPLEPLCLNYAFVVLAVLLAAISLYKTRQFTPFLVFRSLLL